VIDAKTNSGQIVIDLVRSKDFYSECILALSNNEIKDIKNDILKRIPVYTDNLDAISSYIVNEQRKAKIRKKEY